MKIYVLVKTYVESNISHVHSTYDNIEAAEAVKRAIELADELNEVDGVYWMIETRELNAWEVMGNGYFVRSITIKYDIDTGKAYSYDVKECPEYTVWNTADDATWHDDEQGEYVVYIAAKTRKEAVRAAMERYVEHLKVRTRRMSSMIYNMNQTVQRLSDDIKAGMYW